MQQIHLWTSLDTSNISHRDEIHQLSATTLEAIHEADRLLIPANVVDTERQSSNEEVVMRNGGTRTRGGGVRTKGGGVHTRCGGVRTRGGGVRTRGGHISNDPHFLIDDASLDFPSSLPLQHTVFTFSTPLDQSLPHSSVPFIDEGVIQEDVETSFIQELLHSYIDGPSFHIPMSSSIEVSFTPPIAPLIALSPQSLRHSFRDDVATQMQYFPTPLVEQRGENQVQDQGRGRKKGNGATLDGPSDQSELEKCH
ncbi:hypothetical protein CK203_103796 [Vitis vinifera]|uniref:Uncharacterized protein n=1 Tax=Vitis vinifera TaxID=29760 RepID=A0A438CTK0_VITVI|nr:hypothetical protein CK203_103796 [Vitis vinifera]